MAKFNASPGDRAELFNQFIANQLSVQSTELVLTRVRRKKGADTQDMQWLDRDGLMDLHKNEDVVDQIIKNKVKQKLTKPHPDCPHLKAKTLYYVTTAMPVP